MKAELAEIATSCRPASRLDIAFDSSIFIERSLADVRQTIFEAIVLVVVVIYLFLRTLRATLVPAVAIPVSIIGTFAVLDLLGFSINTLTLMGLTLAIGLVVDDAIVVLENITRWVEDGHAAARGGAPRHGRDLVRGGGGDDLGDRGLPAARLPDRHDRPAVPRVRRHGRGGGRRSPASSR